MNFLVTGATGFIGRYLVGQLLEEASDTVFLLVRDPESPKLERLLRWWKGSDRIVLLRGDLTVARCGIRDEDVARLRGRIAHFLHLGAIYDLSASAGALELANVAGTRHALALALDVRAQCFHFCSSIAAAGRYDGVFTEAMFDEAYGLDHPYFRTKHEGEAIVRRESRIAWRIYRPGMVVGHSETGHITKVDGPYYTFKALQILRRNLPPWLPTIGIEGGYINLVPVDYVARAIAYLCRREGLDGRCFHLTDPQPRHAGEVLNLFARAGHAPPMTVRIDARLLKLVPASLPAALVNDALVRAVVDELLEDLQLPRAVIDYFDLPTLFDNAATRRLLEEGGIHLPVLDDYAWRLWDYWERHLDPELSLDRSLSGAVKGKRVLITGGSSGIGRATALRVAQAGAQVLIVARDRAKLEETQAEITRSGGEVSIFECDITNESDTRKLVADVIAEFGGLDVLINNAGRSIRRSIAISYERLHDFERLMQLNYFATVRLTLAFLPQMVAQRSGHVIVISSLGVLSNAPRFAGYAASKAALETFARCASSEYRDDNIRFTVINMPLVRTPMVAPTRLYTDMHMLGVQEAATLVAEALIHKPPRVVSRLGVFAQLLEVFAPRVADIINNTYFHMFPDSAAARGDGSLEERPTREAVALANLLKGFHW